MIKHAIIEVNGAKLHVARTGRGRPLLLHGWPEFWLIWEPVMTRLADRFELIAPDLRGFGDSDKPIDTFGPPEQAADMAALIKALQVDPIGIVAHDVGATVTQVLARHSPDLIAGLFFFNFMYPGIGSRFTAPDHVQNVWHMFFNQTDLAPKLVGATPDSVRLYITYFLKHWAYRQDAFDDAAINAFVANFQRPGNLKGGFQHYRAVAEQRKTEMSQDASTPNRFIYRLVFAGLTMIRPSTLPGLIACRNSFPIWISRRFLASVIFLTERTRIKLRTRSPASLVALSRKAGALEF